MMEHFITITPNELYYLGTILQAKYIDYAYVAAMEDIRHNYALCEAKTRSALADAGILIEDFAGNIEIEQKAKDLVMPIFFGEFESCVDITTLGEEADVTTKRFHSYNGAVTMVSSTVEGKLRVAAISKEEIAQLAAELLPENYCCESVTVTEELQQEDVTRIIAIKNTVIGKSAVVKLFLEADGIMYQENSENKAESMTADAFVKSVLEIIREVA